MKKFLDEFKLKNAIILTKDIFEKKLIDGKDVELVPIWAFSILKNNFINKF